MPGQIDWDDDKADRNAEKHGVKFDEAQTVFYDPRAVTVFDEAHSDSEDRFVTTGFSAEGNLLTVVYSDDGESIRIISARPATKREAKHYASTQED